MKKQWKKLEVIAVSLCMAVCVSACGQTVNKEMGASKDHVQDAPDTVIIDSEVLEELEAQEELAEYLEEEGVQEIVRRGYLMVGCRDAAYSMSVYNAEAENYEGYEIDLAYHIAAKIFGVSYEEAVDRQLVHFELIKDTTWKGMLASGEIDYVIGGVSGTYVNPREYVASAPYYTEKLCVMEAGASGQVVNLDGAKIGVLKGANIAKTLAQYATTMLLGTNPVLVEYEDGEAAKQALANGEIQAFCAPYSVLRAQLTDGFTINVNVVGEQTCVVMSKAGSGLGILSHFLVNEFASDGITETLLAKWALQ